MLRHVLNTMFEFAESDDWSGDLISRESTKIHETVRELTAQMTSIIVDPNARDIDKEWAKKQLEKM